MRVLGPPGFPLSAMDAERVIDIMFRMDLCVTNNPGQPDTLLVPSLLEVGWFFFLSFFVPAIVGKRVRVSGFHSPNNVCHRVFC